MPLPSPSHRRLLRCFRSPALLLSPLLLLTGCGGFFADDTSGGGSGTSATNYAFVTNAGANTVTGLGISTSGTLSTLSGSPLNLAVTPRALVVSRDNKYLWVGTVSQIFGYSIASNGTLAALNSGQAIANANCVDMQVSPDGKWLMVLDGSGVSVDLFGINADGTLAASSGASFNANGTVVPRQLRISPTGSFVVAAMGTAGEVVLGFNTTTGVMTYLSQTLPPDLTSDNGITIDKTGTYLYTARSGTNAGLVVFSVASNGALTPTTTNVYATGASPYSVVLDNTGAYLYVANRDDGTISGWTVGANAALTALAGSPYPSGVGVQSLGADATGKWILAAAYSGSPDLSLYGFSSTSAGRLTSISSMPTGTNASVLALSH